MKDQQQFSEQAAVCRILGLAHVREVEFETRGVQAADVTLPHVTLLPANFSPAPLKGCQIVQTLFLGG